MQKQSRQVWLFPAPTVHPLHDADIADRNKYRCDLQLIDIFSCSSVGGLLYKYVYASLPRFHSYRTQIWGLNDCPTSPSVDIRICRFSICHVLPQCSMSCIHCRFVICIFCDIQQKRQRRHSESSSHKNATWFGGKKTEDSASVD